MLQITPEERQALRLLAAGLPADAIAARLATSEFDLQVQLRTLFARMGAASQGDAVKIARRRGLLAPSGAADNLDSAVSISGSPVRHTCRH